MSDPLPYRGKKMSDFAKKYLQRASRIIKNKKFLFIVIGVAAISLIGKMTIFQTATYAQAAGSEKVLATGLQSPLFEKKDVFKADIEKNDQANVSKPSIETDNQESELEQNLLGIVGETPIREMVPFIAKRDNKVAAFLIGIAKKESSFGLASPSKNGNDCHNYWGYKGVGSRGEVGGYGCFGSAQEAIEIVGNRIEVLVDKDLGTPTRMVDNWKCGRSCAGDHGAPGWVSTVALYFDKIVKNEG